MFIDGPEDLGRAGRVALVVVIDDEKSSEERMGRSDGRREREREREEKNEPSRANERTAAAPRR